MMEQTPCLLQKYTICFINLYQKHRDDHSEETLDHDMTCSLPDALCVGLYMLSVYVCVVKKETLC